MSLYLNAKGIGKRRSNAIPGGITWLRLSIQSFTSIVITLASSREGYCNHPHVRYAYEMDDRALGNGRAPYYIYFLLYRLGGLGMGVCSKTSFDGDPSINKVILTKVESCLSGKRELIAP